MTTRPNGSPRARRPALAEGLSAQGDHGTSEVVNGGSHSGRPFLSMRALSGRSQSLEVFTMAASLAALLRRDILPSRDVLAELDGYAPDRPELPALIRAKYPTGHPARALIEGTRRVSFACERGSATVAGIGASLVGACFVGAVLYSVLVPTLSKVLEVLS
jgi:hypothetical protein